MSHLITLERMVIESLSKECKAIYDLSVDTGLSEIVLLNILPNLVMSSILTYKNGTYALNIEKKDQWLPVLKDTKGVKAEVLDLLSSLVNDHFSDKSSNSNLRLQKIYVSDKDEQVLDILIQNIDNFVAELRAKNGNRGDLLKNKKIIFWGQSTYQNLINGILQSV